MDNNEAPLHPPPRDARFEVAFRGLAVELVLHPPAAGEQPPSAEEIESALVRTPLDRIQRGLINRALRDLPEATDDVRTLIGTVGVPRGVTEPCAIVLSLDGLAAYAVPAAGDQPPGRRPSARPASAPHADATAALATQPRAGGGAGGANAAAERADGGHEDAEDAASDAAGAGNDEAPETKVSAALLRSLMTSSHVVVGVLDDVVDAFGDGRPLDEIVCVARGEEPVPGRDAEVTFHFDPHPRLVPQQLDDGSVDFHSLLVERSVATGAPLVTLQPAVPGTPGHAVTGSRIDVPPVRKIEIAELSGEHTEIQENQLLAADGGRPVVGSSGKIDVMPVFEVKGNLDYGVGNIDFPGDVVVRGDVLPGFTIRAGGAVSVRGFVEGASITAEHDVAVGGVAGERASQFAVGGDLAAQYLHGARADVSGSATVRREVVNCTLTARRVATSSSGRIVGGLVTAEDEVDAGSLGGTNGQLTEVSVTSREPSAVIRARRGARPGTVLHIGGVRRQLEDALEAASFWDVSGTIVSLPAAIDEDEVRKLRESPEAAA